MPHDDWGSHVHAWPASKLPKHRHLEPRLQAVFLNQLARFRNQASGLRPGKIPRCKAPQAPCGGRRASASSWVLRKRANIPRRNLLYFPFPI